MKEEVKKNEVWLASFFICHKDESKNYWMIFVFYLSEEKIMTKY